MYKPWYIDYYYYYYYGNCVSEMITSKEYDYILPYPVFTDIDILDLRGRKPYICMYIPHMYLHMYT